MQRIIFKNLVYFMTQIETFMQAYQIALQVREYLDNEDISAALKTLEYFFAQPQHEQFRHKIEGYTRKLGNIEKALAEAEQSQMNLANNSSATRKTERIEQAIKELMVQKGAIKKELYALLEYTSNLEYPEISAIPKKKRTKIPLFGRAAVKRILKWVFWGMVVVGVGVVVWRGWK